MFALKALVHDDIEKKTFMAYTADCLGTIVKSFGSHDVPLFSEIMGRTLQKELKPQEIVDHVKQLFS